MRTDSDNLIDAGRAQATPSFTSEARDGMPFIVDNEGRARSLEQFCAKPVRPRGTYRAADFESAKRFIDGYRNPNTVIFWTPPLIGRGKLPGKAEVIINFHSKSGEADFCDYLVRFKCTQQQLKILNLPILAGTYQ